MSGTDQRERLPPEGGEPVLARLSALDRFLPVWIIAAMAAGLALGRTVLSLADGLDSVRIGSISLPIAVGLLLMMYPVMAKVRYRRLERVTGDGRMLVTSLALNWLIGPLIEAPVLVALVYLALALRRRCYSEETP